MHKLTCICFSKRLKMAKTRDRDTTPTTDLLHYQAMLKKQQILKEEDETYVPIPKDESDEQTEQSEIDLPGDSCVESKAEVKTGKRNRGRDVQFLKGRRKIKKYVITVGKSIDKTKYLQQDPVIKGDENGAKSNDDDDDNLEVPTKLSESSADQEGRMTSNEVENREMGGLEDQVQKKRLQEEDQVEKKRLQEDEEAELRLWRRQREEAKEKEEKLVKWFVRTESSG